MFLITVIAHDFGRRSEGGGAAHSRSLSVVLIPPASLAPIQSHCAHRVLPDPRAAGERNRLPRATPRASVAYFPAERRHEVDLVRATSKQRTKRHNQPHFGDRRHWTSSSESSRAHAAGLTFRHARLFTPMKTKERKKEKKEAPHSVLPPLPCRGARSSHRVSIRRPTD